MTATRVLASFVLTWCLAACGGGGADTAAGPAPAASGAPAGALPGDPEANLGALATAFEGLSHADPAADADAIVAAAKALPGVADAGISGPGVAWVLYKDGVSSVIHTAPRDEAEDALSARPAAVARQRPLAAGLPAGRQAFLYNALDEQSLAEQLSPTIGSLRNWFAEHGYSGVANGFTNPGDLRKITNAAVFYLDTHGGIGVDVNRQRTYTLATSLPVTSEMVQAFRSEILRGEMGYVSVARWFELGQDRKTGLRLAHYLFITPTFVRNNMSFVAGSLVFINGCSLMENNPEALAMREAFKAKGASVLLGWDNIVNARQAADTALFLFDRLLGSNGYDGYKESIPNRPFNLPAVLKDMKERKRKSGVGDLVGNSLTLDSSSFIKFVVKYDAKLTMDAKPGFGKLSLAPSISGLQLQNLEDKLTLYGDFGGQGSTKFKLSIGGTEVKADWFVDRIEVSNLPRSGAGSSGRVEVEIDGAKSNHALINEWRDVAVDVYHPEDGRPGKGEGTAVIQIGCKLNLRASVNTFRVVPSGPTPVAAVTDDPILQDGVCSYDARGRRQGNGYALDLSASGDKTLPWIAPEVRNDRARLDAVKRWAFALGNLRPDGAGGMSMQLSLIGKIVPGHGGPRQTYTYDSGSVSVIDDIGLYESGATTADELRFSDVDDLLPGGAQQSANFTAWGGATKKWSADPLRPR